MHYILVLVISCLALAYEIILFRLLSVSQDASYIGVVISLALLGFGYSGSLLVWLKKYLYSKIFYRRFIITNLVSFVFSIFLCSYYGASLNISPQEYLWDKYLNLWAFAQFFLLSIPFFFASNIINATMIVKPQQLNKIYAVDLWGAALGGILAFLSLFYLDPNLLPMSSYKALSKTKQLPEVKELLSNNTSYASSVVVSSPRVPFRYASGLSINFDGQIPEQLGLFIDGASFFPISSNSNLDYFRFTTEGFIYEVLSPKKVFQLGLGGGDGVRLAASLNVEDLHVKETDPYRRKLLDEIGAKYKNFSLPKINLENYQSKTDYSAENFNLIHISETLGSPSAFSTNPHDIFSELTRENFERMQGPILISLWSEALPRKVLKVESLLRSQNQGREVYIIKSFLTTNYLLGVNKRQAQILEKRAIDLGFRFTKLNYIIKQNTLFDDKAPTLNKPFIKGAMNLQALTFFIKSGFDPRKLQVEAGFILPYFALLAAFVFSLLLILLPLWPLRNILNEAINSKTRFVAYFASLGLAFMLIEVTLLQFIKLMLGYPILSITLGLSIFLAFAGLGSLYVKKLIEHQKNKIISLIIFFSISIMSLLSYFLLKHYVFFIDNLFLKILIITLCYAPLAFLMGIPFAFGLQKIASKTPALAAWAWGINGCASVVSAILAQILHPYLGFQMVLIIGSVIYFICWFSLPQSSVKSSK